jgi:hypothetical protein
MHMNRFVVFEVENEWLVTYGDRQHASFTAREDAERSAFRAADALASDGHAVSVLILPTIRDANLQPKPQVPSRRFDPNSAPA